MKRKNFVFLLVALGLLVVVYLVQQLNPGRKSIKESMIKLFPGFDTGAISYVRVYKSLYPDSGISFARVDTSWIVSSHYGATARKADIERLLNDIQNLVGEPRAASADLFADFGLKDDEALHLEFLRRDSTVIAHILAGKGVPEAPRSSFVRKAGNDTVFKAEENLISRFGMWNAEPSRRIDYHRWVDLRLVDLPMDSLQSLELSVKGKPYRFRRELKQEADTASPAKYVWQQIEPTSGKVLEDREIADIANRLIGLRATDIIKEDDTKRLGLDTPEYQATLFLSGDKAVKFDFGALADTVSKTRYVMASGNPLVYKVADYIFESIFVKPFEKKK